MEQEELVRHQVLPVVDRSRHEWREAGRLSMHELGDFDNFEYTLTRRAIRQIKFEAWNEGYEARQTEEYSEYVQYGTIYRDLIPNPYVEEEN